LSDKESDISQVFGLLLDCYGICNQGAALRLGTKDCNQGGMKVDGSVRPADYLSQ